MVFLIRHSITLSLLILFSGTIEAQNPEIFRSTLGSATIYINPKVESDIAGTPQSTGQASVTGSFNLDHLLLIQGFLHPMALSGHKTNNPASLATVYPNPFTSSFTVSIPEEERGESILKLHNINGLIVYRDNNYQGHPLTITLDNLPAGIYFLTITRSGKVFYSKLIKES